MPYLGAKSHFARLKKSKKTEKSKGKFHHHQKVENFFLSSKQLENGLKVILYRNCCLTICEGNGGFEAEQCPEEVVRMIETMLANEKFTAEYVIRFAEKFAKKKCGADAAKTVRAHVESELAKQKVLKR